LLPRSGRMPTLRGGRRRLNQKQKADDRANQ
jgi:hypothetical protein